MQKKYTIVFVMSLAMGLITFELTAVNVALPQIATYFHVSLNELSWVLSTYLIGWMILVLPAGKAADILGKKRVFVWGLVVFAAGSALAGIAMDFPMMLAGRFFQGIGAAIISPQTVVIAREAFSKKEQGVPVGYIFLGAAIGLSSGPLVAGIIIHFLSWRSLFLFFLPFGSLVAAVTLRVVTKDVAPKKRPAKQKIKIVHLEVFQNRRFVIGVICRVCVNFSSCIALMTFPLFFQNVLQHTPVMAGLMMIPLSIGFGFGGVLAGQLSKRFDNPVIIIGAGLSMALGYAMMLGISLDFRFWYYLIASIFLGFGGGGLTSSITSLALHNLKKSIAGYSSAMLFFFVPLGNMLGFTFAAMIINSVGSATLKSFLAAKSVVLNPAQFKGLTNVFSGATQLSHLPRVDQNLPHTLLYGVSSSFVSGFHWVMALGMGLGLLISGIVLVFIVLKPVGK